MLVLLLSPSVWMWERYPDGGKFLHSYELEGFDKDRVWRVLALFFLCDLVVYLYLLLPDRNTLHRRDSTAAAASGDRFMSMDSDIDEGLLASQRCVHVLVNDMTQREV
jgi:hypothetical protein